MNSNDVYNLAYEKLFMPETYHEKNNYTLDKAFAISNEQLDNLFKHFDLAGKKVVTVGSSGDQALNAILKGSKNITIIDANIFTRVFIEYKLAVIKTYDFKSFSDIFIKSDFFDWKVYSKISHLLSKNVQFFWDSLMIDITENHYETNLDAKILKEKMLIVDHRDRHSKFYKDENTYNKLQSLLNDPELSISFLNAYLENFPSVLNNKYDFIYLSNIYDYYKDDKEKTFIDTIRKLYKNNLKNNGLILVNYNFNEENEDSSYKIGEFEITDLKISRYSDGTNNQDGAWIIKKKAKEKNKSI